MTTGDIKLIREFVKAVKPWYDNLNEEQKHGSYCIKCGVIPERILKLSETLTAFLLAYDEKNGKK